MQLIPKALVVGFFVPPPGVPGAVPATMDKLNRIWSELSPKYGLTQFQSAPNGAAAQFLGATPDIGVAIEPPLIQVRDLITMTPEQSADKAQDMAKTIGRVLGANQFFNLGVKLVYNAPIENNDAKSFVRDRLLGGGGANIGELDLGGDVVLAAKYVIAHGVGTYTLSIEPLNADEFRSLFLDLDAQFPGPLSLDDIAGRVHDVKEFLTNHVNRYLDGV